MIKAMAFNDACMHLGPDEVKKKGGHHFVSENVGACTRSCSGISGFLVI